MPEGAEKKSWRWCECVCVGAVAMGLEGVRAEEWKGMPDSKL